MNTLQDNPDTRSWREVAAGLPRPAAILAVSAHWVTRGTAVTAMARPETVHDFSGFPRELSMFRYPAPGDPHLAARVAACLSPHPVAQNQDWGLDHGTWSVLAHLFPEADVPVVQLSLDGTRPAAWHYDLARRLKPLRDAGVLILGSGNGVHNLCHMDWERPQEVYGWAERFNDALRRALRDGDHARLAELVSEPGMDADAHLAVPTPEHYLPLLYIAALQEPGEPLQLFNDHIVYGSIGMLSFRVG